MSLRLGDGGAADGVRCSRRLGVPMVQTGYMVYRMDREHG